MDVQEPRLAVPAPQCAGVIHSDFERGFIRAEVYAIPDLLEHGSEAALKGVGKLRVEGKAYEVQDGDVMHFRFNVSRAVACCAGRRIALVRSGVLRMKPPRGSRTF